MMGGDMMADRTGQEGRMMGVMEDAPVGARSKADPPDGSASHSAWYRKRPLRAYLRQMSKRQTQARESGRGWSTSRAVAECALGCSWAAAVRGY